MIDNIKKAREHHRYEIDPYLNEALADALTEKDNATVASIVNRLSITDIVDFFTTANNEQREYFINLYGADLNPQILMNMDDALLNLFVEIAGCSLAAKIIINLKYDDIVHIIRTLDEDLREDVLLFLPNSVSKMLHFVLSYPEKSAGRLIQKDVIAVPYTWDVAKSIEFLENHHVITEELVQVFVVDEEGCPVGFVPIAKLFFSDKRTNIVAIMNKNIKIIRPDMDQEEVVHIFRKYALISAPVVDENGTMIGYIAADDIAEVMGTEIERDILNLGGILENDIYSTVLRTVRSRFPWLFINIAMATITSSVIGFFDDTIGKMVILAILMPIIASTGGNAGIQSVTVIIRGLAKREITNINVIRVVLKEIFSGLISGILISSATFIILFFLFDNKGISIVFSISVIAIFIFSSSLGSIVPLMLDYFDIDPAVASSIIVTTSTDIASYSIFLGLATIFLIK